MVAIWIFSPDIPTICMHVMPCIKSVLSLKKRNASYCMTLSSMKSQIRNGEILQRQAMEECVKFSLPSSQYCTSFLTLFAWKISSFCIDYWNERRKNTILSMNSTNISNKIFETSMEQVEYGEWRFNFKV